MLLSLIGYLFCLVLGTWGAYYAGTLVMSHQFAATLDNLFMTLFAGLMSVSAFAYLAWRFVPALAAGGGTAASARAPAYVLPPDPTYVDEHIPMFNKVWIGLLVLTAVEVVLAYVQLASLGVMLLILIVLSVVKAAMIMSRFMHLHFDHGHLKWIVAVPTVGCILIMCGYFFPDSFRLADLRP